MESLKETIPALVTCINERGTVRTDESRAALIKLRRVFDGLSKFVLDSPLAPDMAHELASDLTVSVKEFVDSLELLGFRVSQTDSLAAFLTRKLDAIVGRIAGFLDND